MSESFEVKAATGWYRVTATPDGPKPYEIEPIPDPEPDTYKAQERKVYEFDGRLYGAGPAPMYTFTVDGDTEEVSE